MAVRDRVLALAREDLAARAGWARDLAQTRRAAQGREVHDRLVAMYAGTPLATEAEAARQAFLAALR
jgi:hypothetical protein